MLRNAELVDIAEETSDILSNPLTDELRSMASAANWPDYIVQSLTVEADGKGELVINYPESLTLEIENLEYGDINSLPNAVLRPFIYRSHPEISKAIEQYAVGELMETLGVV